MKLRVPWWLPVGSVPEISPEQLKDWLENGRHPQLLDARTRLEYDQGTIGAAQHAPLTGMPDSLASVELAPERPVIMLCLSGHRSLPGTRWLLARGYEAYSMRGGILAWKQAGYALNTPNPGE